MRTRGGKESSALCVFEAVSLEYMVNPFTGAKRVAGVAVVNSSDRLLLVICHLLLASTKKDLSTKRT